MYVCNVCMYVCMYVYIFNIVQYMHNMYMYMYIYIHYNVCLHISNLSINWYPASTSYDMLPCLKHYVVVG